MIQFSQIEKLFAFNTKQKYCCEILFSLTGNPKYDFCWMGKMWDEKAQRNTYWYGLTPDGKNAYDYSSFEEMANAPVFDGLSLKDVWDQIVIEEIDDADPEQRIKAYLGEETHPRMMGAPK